MFSSLLRKIHVGRALGFAAVIALPSMAEAQAPKKALRCAVEAEDHILASKQVCERLGSTLQREVVRVADARSQKSGDAVQIVGGDVQWIVVWLHDGRVRAWTRISKTLAEGKELETLARATRALFAEPPASNERCVRVDPNAGRRMRAFDLAYPWAELKKCAARTAEVADPWWSDS